MVLSNLVSITLGTKTNIIYHAPNTFVSEALLVLDYPDLIETIYIDKTPLWFLSEEFRIYKAPTIKNKFTYRLRTLNKQICFSSLNLSVCENALGLAKQANKTPKIFDIIFGSSASTIHKYMPFITHAHIIGDMSIIPSDSFSSYTLRTFDIKAEQSEIIFEHKMTQPISFIRFYLMAGTDYLCDQYIQATLSGASNLNYNSSCSVIERNHRKLQDYVEHISIPSIPVILDCASFDSPPLFIKVTIKSSLFERKMICLKYY